uniref:Glycosyltransferase n=1 Tax=Curvibacter symbiont subsp. Hydra magnipapillata TaxID=667019 RepID=C9Y8C0_CURXX|nr:hypothetical protein Csp_A03710 [Curvibacter putative symbiont of Hydra magnipapillata]
MRILHLSMLYPPHIIGGAEKSVALLAEAQSAAGHQVAASCTTPGAAVQETINGVSVYRMPHETDFWAEEWPQHSSLERGLRRIKMPFNSKLERRFSEVIEDFKPDVVHTHSMTDVSTRAWLAAREQGVPIVHTLRDYDLLCAHSSMFKDGQRCTKRHLKCQFFTHFKKDHHLCVSAVVGVGAEILQTHIDHGYFAHVPADLRRVIWNPAVVDGVPPDYQKPALNGPIVFGYLGRISVDKGVGKLFEACRKLPRDGWRLVLAGRPAQDDEPLMNAAGDLPVDFLGFISPKVFFEQIDVLVAPSIWAEPLPRTILESYAMGIPALGADSGGIPDLIGHNNTAWLYPATDAEALAERMQSILAAGRTALPGRATFQSVLDRTTPERVLQNYDEVYQRVVVQHG